MGGVSCIRASAWSGSTVVVMGFDRCSSADDLYDFWNTYNVKLWSCHLCSTAGVGSRTDALVPADGVLSSSSGAIISSQHPRSAPGSILSHHIFGFLAWGWCILGAMLGADVQHAYPSISQFTAIMRTAVTWPMYMALGFGFFYFVGALAVDIIRTPVSVRRRCAEGVLKMCAAKMGGVSGGSLEGVWCFLSRCWLAELKTWPLVIFSAVISVVAIPCFLVRLVRWMVETYSTFMAGG